MKKSLKRHESLMLPFHPISYGETHKKVQIEISLPFCVAMEIESC